MAFQVAAGIKTTLQRSQVKVMDRRVKLGAGLEPGHPNPDPVGTARNLVEGSIGK